MRNSLLLLCVAITIISCSRVLYDINYQGEDNYKPFYVVDTIVIANPVRVYSEKFGGPFIVDSTKLKDFDNSIEFFLSPDVFILGFDFYRDLVPDDYRKFVYPDFGGCGLESSEIVIQGLVISEYKAKPVFVLGLINTNYYHLKHSSETYFNIPLNHKKISYHKIVYPLCR